MRIKIYTPTQYLLGSHNYFYEFRFNPGKSSIKSSMILLLSCDNCLMSNAANVIVDNCQLNLG